MSSMQDIAGAFTSFFFILLNIDYLQEIIKELAKSACHRIRVEDKKE